MYFKIKDIDCNKKYKVDHIRGISEDGTIYNGPVANRIIFVDSNMNSIEEQDRKLCMFHDFNPCKLNRCPAYDSKKYAWCRLVENVRDLK
jgi:hypothetical protein